MALSPTAVRRQERRDEDGEDQDDEEPWPLGVERAPPVFRIAVVCVSPSWGTDERPVRYWTYGYGQPHQK